MEKAVQSTLAVSQQTIIIGTFSLNLKIVHKRCVVHFDLVKIRSSSSH